MSAWKYLLTTLQTFLKRTNLHETVKSFDNHSDYYYFDNNHEHFDIHDSIKSQKSEKEGNYKFNYGDNIYVYIFGWVLRSFFNKIMAEQFLNLSKDTRQAKSDGN